MKKTITIIGMAMLISIIAIVFNGCKGKDGAPGATGPAGNANVQNYDITISSWQWTYTSTYERWYYRFSCTANSNSLVYAYVMSGSGKQSIPYYTCPSWECVQYDMATYLFGSPPYIEFQFTNYTSKTTAPTSDEYFYLVVVPPASRLANPNVDWTNYEEVKRTFNLGEPIKIKAGDVIK